MDVLRFDGIPKSVANLPSVDVALLASDANRTEISESKRTDSNVGRHAPWSHLPIRVLEDFGVQFPSATGSQDRAMSGAKYRRDCKQSSQHGCHNHGAVDAAERSHASRSPCEDIAAANPLTSLS